MEYAPSAPPEPTSLSNLPTTSSPATMDTENWGNYVMSQPTIHPDSQFAGPWKAADHQELYHPHSPYLVFSQVKKHSSNPFGSVVHLIHKGDSLARNIWHNLHTGPSVAEAAWDKVNLTAKAITEGGFECIYNRIFPHSDPTDVLKKKFACYLSTTAGPVGGTLYLSTASVAFCSDRPLCLNATPGQEFWSYFKVLIPLERVETVNPVTMGEKSTKRCIQIVTVDAYEFWFMGFVNFEKASMHLINSVAEFKVRAGIL